MRTTHPSLIKIWSPTDVSPVQINISIPPRNIFLAIYVPIGLKVSWSLRINAKEMKKNRQNHFKHQVDGRSLTWLGERNSWLFSLMYIFSPSNCGQTERRLKFDWSDSWDKGKSFAYPTEHEQKEKTQSSQSCQERDRHLLCSKPYLDTTERLRRHCITS